MAVQPANKKFRQTKGNTVEDVLNIGNLIYNKASGAQKNVAVGPHLKPLINDASVPSYTTNATVVKSVRPGTALAIYNNSGTVASITLGEDNTIASLAAGVTDAAGHVGVPCTPNSWTYISVFDKRFVIASSANLLVFVMEDDTYIAEENPNR